jgi:hypothetical protein
MLSAFSLLRCLLCKHVGKEVRKIILVLGVNAASSRLHDTLTNLTSSPKSHKYSSSLSEIVL